MKTTSTTFCVALAFAVSLLAVEAQARSSGHSGGGHSSHANHSHSSGSLGKTNLHQGKVSNLSKLGQGNKLNTAGGKNLSGKLSLNNGLASNLNKNFGKGFDKSKSGKGKNLKWFPGKSWWGYGGFGGWGWGGWWNDGYCGNCWPGFYCCQPWCWNPYCNVCSEYCAADYSPCCTVEPVLPAMKVVRIVNPVETRTTLGFAVNGQSYSLEAGKSQDLEGADGTVIEFDRGSDNSTGRYTLSEGEYRFASTPQGWELYRSNDGPQANSVAAN